ncbi:MAG: cytochrome c oxidase subunit II [Gaiellaceae bacterium]
MRRLLFLTGVLVLAAVAAPAGLADNGGFTLIEPNSPNAGGIQSIFWFVTGFALFIFLLVEVALVVFVVRYRRRRRDRFVDGANVHGSTQLELLWTAGPVVILALIAGFVFVQLADISDPPEAQAGLDDSLGVSVVGRQFSWQYEYPNGVISIDTLRVPAGVPVRLELTAPEEDVIHSWWIPALQGKRDVIPGSPQDLWFRADRPGRFFGQCTELCGLEHAKMTTTTEVLPPAAFDAWLDRRLAQQQAGDSPLGEEVWEGVCAKCHGIAGEGGIAPRIAGSPTLTDREALEELVRNGRRLMPPVGSEWTDDQIDALVDYLRESPPSGQQG